MTGPTEQREWGEGWPKGLSVSCCDVCDDPDDLLKVPGQHVALTEKAAYSYVRGRLRQVVFFEGER